MRHLVAASLAQSSTRRVAPPPAGGGSSVLETLAASMSAGTWAQITTATGQNSVTGSGGGNSGSRLHYGNGASWNPQQRRIEMVGADHADPAPLQMPVMAYTLDTNAFTNIWAQNGAQGTGPGHTFDHNVINPATGYGYQVQYGSSLVVKARLGNASEAFSTTLPANATILGNITWGSCWWSGSFTGAGAQGCLLVYVGTGTGSGSSSDGAITAYDPLSNTWFWTGTSMAPFSGTGGATYHCLMEYSAIHNCAVYGGGNATDGLTTKLWRLNSDRTMTPMPSLPTGLRVGILRGNLVCDPETGNFLLLANQNLSNDSEFWELNPTGSGTWTQLTGSRAPPSGWHPAPFNSSGTLDQTGLLSVGLPLGAGMNVVVYIKQTGPSDGELRLYKHA